MELNRKYLLLFGPLTITIEWLGFLICYRLARGLDLNVPLSLLTTAQPPLPTVFATILCLAAVSFFLFCLALKPYAKHIVPVALFASITLALTGFTRYTGLGGVGDLVHNLSIYSSLAAMGAIVWMMKKHPHEVISTVSGRVFVILLVFTVIVFLSINVLHRYVAYIQLLGLLLLQTWLMIIVWHSRYPLEKQLTSKHE